MVTKQDIIDYVMNTPENTNRTVLQSLLDNLTCPAVVGEATVTESSQLLEEENVQ